MHIHHADEAVVGEDQMAAAAGAQDFGAVLFERNVASDGGNFMAHHVGGAQTGERLTEGYLGDTFLRGGEQEPTDECDPQPLGNIAIEGPPRAQENHRVGNQLATGACDSCGLGEIFAYTPHKRAENTATVQRESGKQVEHREPQVRLPKPGSESSHHLAVGKEQSETEKDSCEEAARQWPGDGDVEFFDGPGRFAADAGDATEDKQSDGNDWNFVMLGDHAVRQLVKNDRSEEKQASQHTDGPVLCCRPLRMLLCEANGEGVSDQGENKKPGRVNVDGNP